MPAVDFRLILCFAIGWTMSSLNAAEVRVKDITTVEGARSNQLQGPGLVIGLNGTGARSLATQQLAIDALRKLEQTTLIQRQTQLDNVFKSTSISQVWVTTEISPYSRKGSRLDVMVSMIDDGISLQGGTLLFAPLYGADREVYAVAQGNLSIGGIPLRGSGANSPTSHPTNARIPNGAIVEKEALGQIDLGGFVRLLLRDADNSTATAIAQAINAKYPAAAKAIDGGSVQVQIPMPFACDVPMFVSELGLLRVTPDTSARVVINERTGTVVVGQAVRISAVAIAHRSVVIKPNVAIAPTLPGQGGSRLPGDPDALLPALPRPGDSQRDRIDDILEALRPRPLPNATSPIPPAALLDLEQTTFTVSDLARVLNALGVSPADMIAIFQALKESGAMHADLITI